jgi:hypothetical protein
MGRFTVYVHPINIAIENPLDDREKFQFFPFLSRAFKDINQCPAPEKVISPDSGRSEITPVAAGRAS